MVLCGLAVTHGAAVPRSAAVAFARTAAWGVRARRAGVLFAVLLAGLYAAVFAFSAVPDLDWHLLAMDRLLVLPSAVLLVATAGVLAAPRKGENPCAT
jgi:hypothetical protein